MGVLPFWIVPPYLASCAGLLFLLATLDLAELAGSAAPNKGLVAELRCEVCKKAVVTASMLTKANKIDGEDGLTDFVDNLCAPKTDAGKWIKAMDVVRDLKTERLKLETRETYGVCRKECKVVQQACTSSLNGQEERLVALLQDGSDDVDSIQEELCKTACSRLQTGVQGWEDEAFVPESKNSPPKGAGKGSKKGSNKKAKLDSDSENSLADLSKGSEIGDLDDRMKEFDEMQNAFKSQKAELAESMSKLRESAPDQFEELQQHLKNLGLEDSEYASDGGSDSEGEIRPSRVRLPAKTAEPEPEKEHALTPCQPVTKEDCSQEEIKFIDRAQQKFSGRDALAAEIRRLEGMQKRLEGGSTEKKAQIVDRIAILERLGNNVASQDPVEL
eukprot:TRINITY_DN109388_c0_g1_i1.p1 TRINITY_DN109388_c0_g1~~TRINITY_DN109388_c0_g1_i1.p1  ORF type:complete len:388 (+),score=104.48 TRINITY_DN109388_c0_g1_i1:31-1194(+)